MACRHIIDMPCTHAEPSQICANGWQPSRAHIIVVTRPGACNMLMHPPPPDHDASEIHGWPGGEGTDGQWLTCASRGFAMHRNPGYPHPLDFRRSWPTERMRAGTPCVRTCNCDGTKQVTAIHIYTFASYLNDNSSLVPRSGWPEVFLPMTGSSQSMARGMCTNDKTGFLCELPIS